MFFFLSLRQSETLPGSIEPGILPISTSQYSALPGSFSLTSTTSFREYITDWNLERSDLIRKVACVLAVCLHVPINVLSILSRHGSSLTTLLGIVITVLNLLCVATALWKLDVMVGQRYVWNRVCNRTHFDYVIICLLLVYGFSFGMLVFASMQSRYGIWFFRIVWPFLIATDIFAFIAGWVATWRGVAL